MELCIDLYGNRPLLCMDIGMNCIESRDFPLCGLRINPSPSFDCV